MAPEQPSPLNKESELGPCVPTSSLVTLSQGDRILEKSPVLFTDLIEEKENWSLEPMPVRDIPVIGRLLVDM